MEDKPNIIGYRNKKYQYRLTCVCGAVIEFNIECIKTSASYKRYQEYIECPNCKIEIVILESKL